jgi:MerR family transcriptional regulator, Zn(II)-responsive regulator of zntA
MEPSAADHMSQISFQVNELALRCDVSADTVRYYAKIGLLQPERDPASGYKRFDEKDMKRLGFIRRAKSLGYTLNEIKQILEESRKGKSPCPMVRDLIQRRIQTHRHRLEEQMELQKRMEEALDRWAAMPDGIPDGDSVCVLIESIENPCHGQREEDNQFE